MLSKFEYRLALHSQKTTPHSEPWGVVKLETQSVGRASVEGDVVDLEPHLLAGRAPAIDGDLEHVIARPRSNTGAYDLGINTLNGRWIGEVASGAEWRTVEVPFSALKRTSGRGAGVGPWTGDDVLEVTVDGGRAAGEKMWLEVDNVTFY